MTTFSHEPVKGMDERSHWTEVFTRDLWVSLTISIMWVTVLLDALFGPNIETQTVTSHEVWPSAVPISLFVLLATWLVARYGFRRDERK
jgi:hypothetical protein